MSRALRPWGRSLLSHHDRGGSDCRGTGEVEAEFVDVVTAAHGLDSSQWAFKLRGRVSHLLQKTTTLLLLGRLGVPEARRSPVRKAETTSRSEGGQQG